MWNKDHVWLHYVKNIIAADVPSAVFLAFYLRNTSNTREYTAALEVIDLQKYKVIRQPAKVKVALRTHANTPFVFVVGKN